VIFWRLAGGEEEELLALRVLLLDLVAIFGCLRKANLTEDFVAGPRIHVIEKMDNDGRRINAEFNGNSTRHYLNTLHDRAQCQWERSRQRLLPWLPFLHNCLIV
jgi:hypothetical protein